jgi:hypothetical protein
MKRLALAAAVAAFGLLGSHSSSAAADFAQAKRDAEFLRSARRQDSELLKFYGNQIPAGIRFCHEGSFRAMVHRSGLKRPITLVPPLNLRYEDAEALRSAARSADVAVGAIKLTYGSVEPEIVPGTILILYDGLRVHLHDTHSTDVAQYPASLGAVPADALVDEALGELGKSDHSLANILPDGTFQIYIQLADSKGDPLMEGQSYSKVLLQFSIPGIVDDDDSPVLILAEPKEDDKGSKPANKSSDDDGGSPSGGHSGHHH